MDWLDTQRASLPQQYQDHFFELSQLHQQKLWYQLSQKLLELVQIPFFQSERHILNIYDNIVSKLDKKLKPFDFARFGVAASRQQPDIPSALGFLSGLLKVVSDDEEAAAVTNLEIIRIKIKSGQAEETKPLLDDIKAKLDARPGVLDGVIYSSYYLAALEYHKIRGTAAQFFQNSLLYLAYTPLSSIPAQEQVRLAADVGLASLIGSNVYNFGELLQHPIIKVLDGTEFEWLSHLLFAFNTGNIAKYQEIAEQKAVSQEVLVHNAAFLNQKIRIMALMEMVFHRPSDQRTISFQDISQTCCLPVTEVELLLMKAFSLKVVKGVIDQLDQNVQIKWVQPRVLDKQQISSMRDRMQQWIKQAHETAIYLENNAPELIHRQ